MSGNNKVVDGKIVKRRAMTLYLTMEEEMMFREIISRRPDLPMTKTGIIRAALKEYVDKHKSLNRAV